MAIDPTRPHRDENQEGRVHALYAYLYVTDRDEGLVVIGNPAGSPNKEGVATLLDGDPDNNFLQRALAFNPGGRLTGARGMALGGHYAYLCSDSGLNVVDLDDALHPRLLDTPGLGPPAPPKEGRLPVPLRVRRRRRRRLDRRHRPAGGSRVYTVTDQPTTPPKDPPPPPDAK